MAEATPSGPEGKDSAAARLDSTLLLSMLGCQCCCHGRLSPCSTQPHPPIATARQASGSDSIASVMSQAATASAGVAATCDGAEPGGTAWRRGGEARRVSGMQCKGAVQGQAALLAPLAPVCPCKAAAAALPAHLGARLLERRTLVGRPVPHCHVIPRLEKIEGLWGWVRGESNTLIRSIVCCKAPPAQAAGGHGGWCWRRMGRHAWPWPSSAPDIAQATLQPAPLPPTHHPP